MELATVKRIILVVLVAISNWCYAEEEPESVSNRIWMSVGVGAGTYLTAWAASFSLEREDRIYSIRSAGAQDRAPLNFFPGESPIETVEDVGFLYGYVSRSGNSVTVFSAGIASVTGVRQGAYLGSTWFVGDTYERINYSAVGIPLEFKYFTHGSSSVGYGVYVFGNINKEESFAGILISWHFGAFSRSGQIDKRVW